VRTEGSAAPSRAVWPQAQDLRGAGCDAPPPPRPGCGPYGAVARATEPGIPDLDTVVWPERGQDAAEACRSGDGADRDGPGLRVVVGAGDPALCEWAAAVGAERPTAAGRRQLRAGMHARANRLPRHPPVLCPARQREKGKAGGLSPRLAEGSAHSAGEGGAREQASAPGGLPRAALSGKPACGPHGVPLGRVVQRPGPGRPPPPSRAVRRQTGGQRRACGAPRRTRGRGGGRGAVGGCGPGRAPPRARGRGPGKRGAAGAAPCAWAAPQGPRRVGMWERGGSGRKGRETGRRGRVPPRRPGRPARRDGRGRWPPAHGARDGGPWRRQRAALATLRAPPGGGCGSQPPSRAPYRVARGAPLGAAPWQGAWRSAARVCERGRRPGVLPP